MAMYRPSDLHGFLTGIGRTPKKSLSQNFLIDGNIIRKIIKASGIAPGDKVLEIGPGPGSLTEALLDAGAAVIAVEMDNVLAKELERFKGPTRQLEIFCEDIMTFLQEDRLKTLLKPGEKLKVVANLPYHLTTPIVEKLVLNPEQCISITVMVQEEVARRFTASSKSKEYGSFTLFLEFYCLPHYVFSVGRNCFFPAPKVDSAVVRLDLKPAEQVTNVEDFFKLTRTSFGQRRKMLRGSLKELYTSEKVTHALEQIGCNVLARPEELTLREFIKFYEFLISH
ncbi:MAG: ribosomal RNA small subunit methyltransferase A [Parachlamydiaceae bacterium]|nr:ribosomal RNA small subunit methyltransferase A [Parachlamydiaceae bacterium]